jgi:hypothetical protein
LAEKKLDGDLAARAEKLVLSRTAMVRIALDNHAVDGFAKDAGHDWWSTPGEVGYQWFIGSDWQAESDRLYALAAEVARKIGGR